MILPFQPFDRLSEVLATADVLLAILEPDAGAYSVPSKVLTSFAAGRPILGAIPPTNLAAQDDRARRRGHRSSTRGSAGFVETGRTLMADPDRRLAMGRAGRSYAETAFDIGAITDRFEMILRGVVPDSLGSSTKKKGDRGVGSRAAHLEGDSVQLGGGS